MAVELRMPTCLNKPSATAAKNAAREAKMVSAWRPLRFVLRHVAGRGGGAGRGERPPAVFRVGEMGRKRGSAGLGQRGASIGTGISTAGGRRGIVHSSKPWTY